MRRKNKENIPDFRELIPHYSDEELIGVLKRRSYYIPEASKLAVEEAIKRGIISSEHDLLTEKFREEKLHFTWFPVSPNKKVRDKIRKSISRSLVICGLIPLIYGLLLINKGETNEGALITLFGIVWIFLSSRLIIACVGWYLLILFAANLAATVYVFSQLQQLIVPKFMDYLVVATLFLMINYGLAFIYKSESKFQNNGE